MSIREYRTKVEEFLWSNRSNDEDYRLAQQSLISSRRVLTFVDELGEQGCLRLAPLCVFTRIVSAATLLLKVSLILTSRTGHKTLTQWLGLGYIHFAYGPRRSAIDKARLIQCCTSLKHPGRNSALMIALHVKQLRSLKDAILRDETSTANHGEHGKCYD